jgi:hypothetical protein
MVPPRVITPCARTGCAELQIDPEGFFVRQGGIDYERGSECLTEEIRVATSRRVILGQDKSLWSQAPTAACSARGSGAAEHSRIRRDRMTLYIFYTTCLTAGADVC